MNRAALERLREVLGERWVEMYRESVREQGIHATKQLGRTASRWRGLCRSLDIQALDESYDYEGPLVLEELVIVIDPNPAGMWLEMTHETAEKILTLGLP